jgi:hypothetical protein
VNPKAAQTFGAGVACIVIAVIIGLVGAYGANMSGIRENMAASLIIIAAAVIGLVGLGCLIGGGVMLALQEKSDTNQSRSSTG